MFCYCALSVPDNSYDLTSDRDEWGSYKVRPKIILSPIYLESTFIAKVNSGRVAIIGKKHSLDREGENICEDSHLLYWYFKCHVSFLVRFPLCLLFRKAVALGTGSWRNPLKAPLWRFNTFNTPVDSQIKNMELKVMVKFCTCGMLVVLLVNSTARVDLVSCMWRTMYKHPGGNWATYL